MINFIIIWFKNLSKTGKVFTVIVSLLLLVVSVQSARLARSEYLRLKSIEAEVIKAEKEILLREENELKIIDNNEKKTRKVLKNNNNVNEKLKQDEKIIDTTTISSDELSEYISKHEAGR